jgi:hypothetical protein
MDLRELFEWKERRYSELVAARKAYDCEGQLGLANPARVEGGRYDADEVGPWTRWAGDLNADLMVVGQDWGDVRYFIANEGLDAPHNPTNTALASLLASVGRPVPVPPTASAPLPPRANRISRVFLTNALSSSSICYPEQAPCVVHAIIAGPSGLGACASR